MLHALLLIGGWIGRAFALWIWTLRRPLRAEAAALRERNERLRSENEILRARLARLDSHRRPQFRPWERLAILWHRARYGLSLEATARAFVVSSQTLLNWIRATESGFRRLVATREPMNKLPDLAREIALRLKAEWPRWGTRRIAGVLARLGLKASRTSVQRILRRRPPRPRRLARPHRGPLVARRPGPVWFVDFTRLTSVFRSVVVGAVIDGFSRKILAFRVWRSEPSAADACHLLCDAILGHGKPTWLISDHGVQFTSSRFTRFLSRRKIRRRFGAVGRKGSIAVIERAWRCAKEEWLRGLLLWAPLRSIQRRISWWVRWYNRERPHGGLGLRTPDEVHFERPRVPRRQVERGILEVRLIGGQPSQPAFRLRRTA